MNPFHQKCKGVLHHSDIIQVPRTRTEHIAHILRQPELRGASISLVENFSGEMEKGPFWLKVAKDSTELFFYGVHDKAEFVLALMAAIDSEDVLDKLVCV